MWVGACAPSNPIPDFLKLAVALFLGVARDRQALAVARLVDDAPSKSEAIPPGSALRPLAALAARPIIPFRVTRPSLGTRDALVEAHGFISSASLGGLLLN
jgi:hypothetical protein